MYCIEILPENTVWKIYLETLYENHRDYYQLYHTQYKLSTGKRRMKIH